ncbi:MULTISPECIES: hypothetical protein [Enterococcus]|uniref:hypothetical protein n=1 Tax=Enterococcus TaxID=1350 RepID=UPI0019057CB3|nr:MULTISPECIES: hypothetical protein [Enterococcus]MBK0036248.1 hypothetical protein [Enterococcus sp. S52]MBK0068906.1 hypothetical protein [Enterococcus sp. S53]MBK0143134.1 hypothetical protein [Enterococcus sp. S77]MEB5917749.1 hypothetical protein [Enterococcus innesii]
MKRIKASCLLMVSCFSLLYTERIFAAEASFSLTVEEPIIFDFQEIDFSNELLSHEGSLKVESSASDVTTVYHLEISSNGSGLSATFENAAEMVATETMDDHHFYVTLDPKKFLTADQGNYKVIFTITEISSAATNQNLPSSLLPSSNKQEDHASIVESDESVGESATTSTSSTEATFSTEGLLQSNESSSLVEEMETTDTSFMPE